MRPLIRLATLVAALSIPTAAVAQMDYGDLAHTTALTAADDYRIGKGYMEMSAWMFPVLDDDDLTASVHEIVGRIVAASDRPDIIWDIRVIDSPEMNAAAMPGGFMLVNKGLLDSLPPDEVAFVLAHEISHVMLRHFAATMNMSAAMQVLSAGEAAHAGSDEAALGAAWQDMSRMMTRHSRQLELEADLYGLLYATRAGYPMASSTAAMESMKLLVGEVPDWMKDDSTHPTFSHRISELRNGMKTVKETYGSFDAGVAYARAGDYEAAIPAFEQFLTLFPKSSAGWSNLGTCYLHEAIKNRTGDPWHDELALYLKADVTVRSAGVNKTQLGRARKAFERALVIDPNRDAALANLGVLARIDGDYAGAVALLEKARELDSDYAGYMNNLGTVAASKGDLREADKWFGKAIKADAGADYAKANRARVWSANKGRKKDAIALYEELLGSRKFAEEATEQLIALGALAGGTRPPEFPDRRRAEDSSVSVAVYELPRETPAEAEPAPGKGSAPADTNTKSGNTHTLGLGGTLEALKTIFGTPDFEDSQEDGYYVYAGWWNSGVSATFTDELCTGLEIFPPAAADTGRGISLGADAAAVKGAYGDPTDVYGDRNAGYESWTYDAIGTAFYFGGSGKVVSISMWSL
jgi:predicted Zn-dependent protease